MSQFRRPVAGTLEVCPLCGKKGLTVNDRRECHHEEVEAFIYIGCRYCGEWLKWRYQDIGVKEAKEMARRAFRAKAVAA